MNLAGSNGKYEQAFEVNQWNTLSVYSMGQTFYKVLYNRILFTSPNYTGD